MRPEAIILRVAPVLVGALLFALLAAHAPMFVWPLAVVWGIAVSWIDKAVSLASVRPWDRVLRATCGAAVGVAIGSALTELTWQYSLIPFISGMLAALTGGAGPRVTATPCVACRKPTENARMHRCPRCSGYFCSVCFVTTLQRCTICERGGVRILPTEMAWWASRLGTRVRNGSCRVCKTPWAESDLRGCMKCNWPICTDCWDDNNAICTICGWQLLDLPFSQGTAHGKDGSGQAESGA